MKTQHTPGPWLVFGSGQSIEVRRKTGEKLYGIELNELICMLPHHPDKKLHPQYKANGALIAAAPELLKLLEWMQGTFCGREHELSEYEARKLKEARLAIAKARGEI